MTSNLVVDDEDPSRSRVGPWVNKDEFLQVYKLIYAPEADRISKKKACDMLTVWKIRRQNFTPASILSTLAILEIQIKDDPDNETESSSRDLQTIYSNVFTRFLNFMSSIMQSKDFKSMYTTAKELGIESFLVDLRHLCAHTHILPSLNVFRRSADYCLQWLKEFYWDREIEIIRDASVQNVRLKTIIDFENSVQDLLVVYDATTEALHKNCKFNEIEGVLNEEYIRVLHDFANKSNQNKLPVIATMIINRLIEAACNSNNICDNGKLFCDLVFQCKYFIETTVKLVEMAKPTQTSKFVGLHQNLFRSIAICGFIEPCFDLLLEICENDYETVNRRVAACFWANEIAKGFIIFKEFKKFCKEKHEKNPHFEMDLAPINTESMTKDIRDIYKSLGINCSGVLIFGDTIRRPWALTLDHNFIENRLLNINEYTSGVIENAIKLVDPPMGEHLQAQVMDLVKVYLGTKSRQNQRSTTDDVDSAKSTSYYTLNDLQDKTGVVIDTEFNKSGCKTYGIWSEVSERTNWAIIPMGRPL